MDEDEEFNDFDDDEEFSALRQDYGLDADEAEGVRDLMGEGLDEEEAVEVNGLISHGHGGGGIWEGGSLFSLYWTSDLGRCFCMGMDIR